MYKNWLCDIIWLQIYYIVYTVTIRDTKEDTSMSSKKRVLNPVEIKKDVDYIPLGRAFDFWNNEGDDIYDEVYGEDSEAGRGMDSKR